MNSALSESPSRIAIEKGSALQSCSTGKKAKVLGDIYQEHLNIAIWQRSFGSEFKRSLQEFVDFHPQFNKSLSVSPRNALAALEKATDGSAPAVLLEDLAELVDMFCCLFDLEDVGLRIAVLSNAMCPRFHVDKVPCRLVTTYHGVATDWLPNYTLDRTKLGRGSNGQTDAESGLYADESDIQCMSTGDVALLKGETWIGNEDNALVHRSPINFSGEARLLVTIDFG
ncbi:DUF1826 domain-containing protein [Vibrio paucivorans]|uniref:DUF1826 domain-containing protein n=1 Tax=Vibrio paucivorans TaxID=2829489 RepID=A0A9X3CBG5_9VIBR|nr:DUF1826 domain-containing protein [Vibrio paucivorans]MCW8332580.1 DUF1826 domain-containing protein [Vibrio paucivorans]